MFTVSCKLLSISIAAILGVLTRIGVNDLFGPGVLGVSSSTSALFSDMPANVFGCFVLGLTNSLKSEGRLPVLLGIAISTGYAGSVTSEYLRTM